MSKILIAYGTLTMNTELVAQRVHNIVTESKKFTSADLKNVVDITDPIMLENYDAIIFGVSTWGEGNYNPDTEEFVSNLEVSGPNLLGKKIAIFGLGESYYENFCGAAKALKEILDENFSAKIVDEIFTIDGFPDDNVLSTVEDWTHEIIEKLI